MKQLATIALGASLLLSASFAVAQPTLTAATAVPTPGTAVRILNSATGTTIVSGNSGANQTWDLSGQSFTRRTDTINFHACGNTDDCGTYPGTTVLGAYPQVNGVARYYYIASSTALSYNGNKDSVSGTSFHHIALNPRDVLRFPMTYNTSFIDSFVVMDTSNGAAAHIKRGNDTVLADGWGTLKTPSGTFASVLRVKEIINVQDSSRATPTVTRQRYIVYSWYDAAHPYALAMTSEYSFSGTTAAMSTYADVAPVATGIASRNSGSLALSIYPNPTSGKTTLTVKLPTASAINIMVMDMMGHSVFHSPQKTLVVGDNRLTLETQNLPAGVYTICVVGDIFTATSKLVIE